VIFWAAFALTIVNIEASITSHASSELVQNLESRAVIRIVHACLSLRFLRIFPCLAVLTSSALLQDLPISALLEVAGAASLCGICKGIVQTVLTFTGNIEVLPFSTQSLVTNAISACFIRVCIGKTFLAFTNQIDYFSRIAFLFIIDATYVILSSVVI